jgi:solute carrier family 29 (equilibrative nucleoside transporter), member 1/2/3
MQNWFPVSISFFYCLGDFFGRGFGKSVIIEEWKIGFYSVLRLIFIPIILLCIKPRIFVDDSFVVVVMFLMSFSNGYLVTCSMILAPQKCELHEKALASQIMTFFLIFGIMMGSNLGILLSYLYQ